MSCDSIHSHRVFAEHIGGCSFPILSDWWPHGQAAEAYGVLNSDTGTARRSTFIIDRDSVIRYKKIHEPGTLPDVEELLAELAKL